MQAVKLLQQKPPVLNFRRWLMQAVLHNDCKTAVAVVVVVVVVITCANHHNEMLIFATIKFLNCTIKINFCAVD